MIGACSVRLASATILALCCSMAGCDRSAPTPTPTAPAAPPAPVPIAAATPPLDDARLVAGELPDGTPQAALLRTRCGVCHSADYVTQQRLSAAQWDKVLAKMEKWGASLTPDERGQLATFLATTWRADLAERAPIVVVAPPGATGSKP